MVKILKFSKALTRQASAYALGNATRSGRCPGDSALVHHTMACEHPAANDDSQNSHACDTQPRALPLVNWALLVLPGLIWGSSYFFIAEGLQALAPDGITFLRFVIGFATLTMIPAARRPIQPSDRMGVFGLAVLWLALPMSMFPHAEQHVSSALTGMLSGAIPLIAAAVAALLARKAPPRTVLIGLMAGFGGAILMAIPGLAAGGNSAWGVLLILVALFSYGIAINLAGPLQQRNGALPVVWRSLGIAMILTAPLGAPDLWTAHWSGRPLIAILALGSLGTGIANVVMAVAAGRLGATRASASIFLVPVVALALGVMVRAEHVPVAAIAGAAACLGGAWLVRRATQVNPEEQTR